jgi:hypothetical protein
MNHKDPECGNNFSSLRGEEHCGLLICWELLSGAHVRRIFVIATIYRGFRSTECVFTTTELF